MKMRKMLAGLMLLLGGCASAPEPAEPAEIITPLTLEPPPIYSLLGFRDQLSLQSHQVSALDSIAQATRDLNAPLVDSLRVVGRERGGRYSGMLAVDEATQPLLEQIRQNNRRAVEGVSQVLTAEQRATACRLLEQSTERRRQAQGAGRRSAGRARGAEADSAAAATRGRVWTWCGATEPGA